MAEREVKIRNKKTGKTKTAGKGVSSKARKAVAEGKDSFRAGPFGLRKFNVVKGKTSSDKKSPTARKSSASTKSKSTAPTKSPRPARPSAVAKEATKNVASDNAARAARNSTRQTAQLGPAGGPASKAGAKAKPKSAKGEYEKRYGTAPVSSDKGRPGPTQKETVRARRANTAQLGNRARKGFSEKPTKTGIYSRAELANRGGGAQRDETSHRDERLAKKGAQKTIPPRPAGGHARRQWDKKYGKK